VRISSLLGVFASFATLASVPVEAQTTYRVVALGPLVPGVTAVRAMNNAGQIVGDFVPPGSPSIHGFLFSYPTGILTDLGALGGAGGSSSAYGISSNGKVTGSSSTATSSVFHAFVWANGVMTDIGALPATQGVPSPQAFAVGTAVNDSGQVTGYSYTDFLHSSRPRDSAHAFLYSSGVMTDITTTFGQGYAINNAGQVVGTFLRVDGGASAGMHPFIYQNGMLTDLSPGVTSGDSELGSGGADAINDAGDVVGSLFDSSKSPAVRAFLYSNGTTTDLSQPIPPAQCCSAFDHGASINNAGQVLLQLNRALYLYSAGVTTALKSLVDPTDPLAATVDLSNGSTINDNGWILVGGGGLPTFLLIPATFTVAPASLDFGNQVVGTVSAAKTVTFTNSGTAPVPITSVTAPAPFAVTNNCAASLEPGASCTIDVTFHPTGVDTRNGTLTFNAGDQQHLIALSGTGSFSVSVTSSASSVAVNTSFTLTWSTQTADAMCTASGGSAGDQWNGSVAPSGTKTISEGASGTYTYTVSCDQSLQSAQGQAVVTITPTAAGGTGGGSSSGGSSGGGGGTIDLLSIVGLLALSGLSVARRRPPGSASHN